MLRLEDISKEVQVFPWEAEVAEACLKLYMEQDVQVELDMEANKCEVEYDLLNAYNTYFDGYECDDLRRRLEVADVHGR